MRTFRLINNEVFIKSSNSVYVDTFSNFLQDVGQDSIEELLNSNVKYIYYDDTLKVCNIDYSTKDYPNITIEKCIDNVSSYIANKANREYIPLTFEEVKSNKISQLKSERDTLEVANIEYKGSLFDFDDKARERINLAIIALEMSNSSLEWTLADNSTMEVTAQDLKMVDALVAMRSNILHRAYRVAKDRVNSAETVEEVESIVLELGSEDSNTDDTSNKDSVEDISNTDGSVEGTYNDDNVEDTSNNDVVDGAISQEDSVEE